MQGRWKPQEIVKMPHKYPCISEVCHAFIESNLARSQAHGNEQEIISIARKL